MRLSFNLVNVYTNISNVYFPFTRSMETKNKTQMVLSHDNIIILGITASSRLLTSVRQPSIQFIISDDRFNFCNQLRKSFVVLLML